MTSIGPANENCQKHYRDDHAATYAFDRSFDVNEINGIISPSAPTNGLFHADVEGQQLRGHLLEELSFGFDGCQCVDRLSLPIHVGEDLKPIRGNLSANIIPVPEQKSRHVHWMLAGNYPMIFLWHKPCLHTEI